MRWVFLIMAACNAPDNSTMLIDGSPTDGPPDPFHEVVNCDGDDPSFRCEIACQVAPEEPLIEDNCTTPNPNDSDQSNLYLCFNGIAGVGLRKNYMARRGCCILNRSAKIFVWNFCSN